MFLCPPLPSLVQPPGRPTTGRPPPSPPSPATLPTVKWRYAAPPLVLVAVLAAAAPFLYGPTVQWWWDRTADQPLTSEEASALGQCADPGWPGLLKLLRQDLDTSCEAHTLADALAIRAQGRRRVAWLDQVARSEAAPPRSRLRAALVLLAAGQPPLTNLSLLSTDPQLPEAERADVVQQLVLGELERSWVDPLLWAEVATWHLAEGDLDSAEPVALRLQVEALAPLKSEAERAWLARTALDAAGMEGWVVQEHVQRRQQGLPEQLPPEVALRAEQVSRSCVQEHDPACLRTAAELLTLEAELHTEPPPALLPHALWSVLYQEEDSVAVATTLTHAVGTWVAAAPEGERGWRLLGATTARPSDAPALRADPLQALLHRRAPAGTTALAALSLGQVSGAQVQVQPWGTEHGLLLTADGLSVALDACGRRSEAILPEGWTPEPLPALAVLARAAAEAALDPQEQRQATTLAALALRLDPQGQAGLVEALPEGSGPGAGADALVGARAGRLLSPPSPEASNTRSWPRCMAAD